jgi:two-component system, NtrC family, response regulator AtoC
MPANVLIIDDEEATAIALRDGLRRFDLTTEASFEPEDAIARLGRAQADVVLLDLCLPGASGIDLCRRLAAQYPGTAVIVMSARGSLGSAVAAVKAGARDFVTKPFELETIALRIRHMVRDRTRELDEPRGLPPGGPFADLIGASPAIEQLRRRLTRIAVSDACVLITGESGTGKEVVARGIHRESRRHGGPFVAVNCAAVPEALIESELFGHVRGAFTDARADRAGLFAQARGGTLFLDEIGDLPLAVQPKLLRVLEDRRVRPVGGDHEIALDVRVIAATHQDLGELVRLGRFRSDLMYRLDVLAVRLPALRERGDDILFLARRFAARCAASEDRSPPGLDDDAARALLAHAWPGNVRELRNCMEHAVAMAQTDEIGLDDLPDKLRRGGEAAPTDPGWPPLAEVERRYIDRVLEHTGGNRSISARILGIDRRTLMRKLRAGAMVRVARRA